MLQMREVPRGHTAVLGELCLLLQSSTAKRHVCPLAPGVQATQAADLLVWACAEQEHARPCMPQDVRLLLYVTKQIPGGCPR